MADEEGFNSEGFNRCSLRLLSKYLSISVGYAMFDGNSFTTWQKKTCALSNSRSFPCCTGVLGMPEVPEITVVPHELSEVPGTIPEVPGMGIMPEVSKTPEMPGVPSKLSDVSGMIPEALSVEPEMFMRPEMPGVPSKLSEVPGTMPEVLGCTSYFLQRLRV
ncbi:hypothetical protein ACROYT_G001256 [Oculina patagonica]